MGINKVNYGNTTLIDTSNVTVTADKLLSGITALDNTGTLITGTASGGGGYITQDQDGYVVLSSTSGVPTLINKTITENGTYSASDDGATGYSNVTVNASGGSLKKAYGSNSYDADHDYIRFTALSNEPSMFFIKPYEVTLLTDADAMQLETNCLSLVDATYDGTTTYYGVVSKNGTNTGYMHGYLAPSETDMAWSYSNGTLTVTVPYADRSISGSPYTDLLVGYYANAPFAYTIYYL